MNDKVVVDIIEQEILEMGRNIMKILLKDRTTKKNIIWGTNDYIQFGSEFGAEHEIKINSITGKYTNIIQPRVTKDKKNQEVRTKDKAEVFTPSWICNKQNNLIDNDWFGFNEIFNIEEENGWKAIRKKVEFPKNKTWMDYVLENRLEITCGEAPYLVSRYDTVTGKIISINNRIGLLDRKLRVINENVEEKKYWMKWVKKAFESIYAYEYQGDNLLLARENLLFTFIENYHYKFKIIPEENKIKEIATIISWNVWQMDAIKNTVAYCSKEQLYEQLTLFPKDYLEEDKTTEKICLIKDWKAKKIVEFSKVIGGFENDNI